MLRKSLHRLVLEIVGQTCWEAAAKTIRKWLRNFLQASWEKSVKQKAPVQKNASQMIRKPFSKMIRKPFLKTIRKRFSANDAVSKALAKMLRKCPPNVLQASWGKTPKKKNAI